MINHYVDNTQDCIRHEVKWMLDIRWQLSTLFAIDLDCVHDLPHALLQEKDKYCLQEGNQWIPNALHRILNGGDYVALLCCPFLIEQNGIWFLDLYSSLVPVWACNIQCGPLLQHTSFKISIVHASNAMNQMLFCCIAVFQYLSIICHCGASANAFAVNRVAQLTISKSLALINRQLFHMYSSMSLPVTNTRCVMSEWPNWWMVQLP